MNPDVDSPKKADGRGVRREGEDEGAPPRDTTVTVLNGNGVSGSASKRATSWPSARTRSCSRRTGSRRTHRTSTTSARSSTSIPRSAGAKLAAHQARELVRLRRCEDGDPCDRAARQRLDAGRRPGPDLPRHARLGAGRSDAERRSPTSSSGTDASLDLLRASAQAGRLPADGAHRVERSSWIDRERPIRVYYMDKDKGAQDRSPHVQHGLERVLGRPDDRLGGCAGAERPQLRPSNHGATLRAVLQRPAAAHGRAADRGRLVLGREHASRPALERDDDRDREGLEPFALDRLRCD